MKYLKKFNINEGFRGEDGRNLYTNPYSDEEIENLVVRRSFNFDELFTFLTDLITKYNIRWIGDDRDNTLQDLDDDNHASMPKDFNDKRGHLKLKDNYLMFALPMKEDIYKYIGERNIKKYGIRADDDGIVFHLHIMESQARLSKPYELYSRRQGRVSKVFSSKKKYKVASVGSTGSYFNVEDAEKFFSKFKGWMERFKFKGFDYSSITQDDIKKNLKSLRNI